MSFLYIILLSAGLQDSALVAKHLNQLTLAYNSRTNLHMKVKYLYYSDKKSSTAKEVQQMESWRMGNDYWFYKGKDWEFIQTRNLTLRVDHSAKVLQLQGTYVPKTSQPQDPTAQMKEFFKICKNSIVSVSDGQNANMTFKCEDLGYKEINMKYTTGNWKIKNIGMLASPGTALGEEGGYLKVEFLLEEAWNNKSIFRFTDYLKKEGEKYTPLPAYSAYRFIDQSYLFRNENK